MRREGGPEAREIMEPLIFRSKTGRFRAEVVQESSDEYSAHYFGPGDEDRGESPRKLKVNSTGLENAVRKRLEKLEAAYPQAPEESSKA
jgi:hypothetical protein